MEFFITCYAVMRVGNETEEDEIANIAFSIKENYVTATISSSTVIESLII